MSTTVLFFRSLLEEQPACASVNANLAEALLENSEVGEAILAATHAIELDPTIVSAWLIRATAYTRLGQWLAALSDYREAAMLAPARSGICVSTANCCVELDRLEDAERWLRRAIKLDPENKEAQANLGSVLVRLDRLEEAQEPCLAALALDGSLISAHQNLSEILAEADPRAARAHRDLAYRRKQVFIETAWQEKYRILVLAAADAGNIPLRHLMPRAQCTTIRWYVEYATPGQAAGLPPYDVAFNSIGDPDFIPSNITDSPGFVSAIGDRLLNPFERIRATARHRLPGLLQGIPNTAIPRAFRLEPSAPMPVAAQCPVLVRPLGSHGGKGVIKADTMAQLESMSGSGCYVTEFVDFRSTDGWYRKYRAIFVDGRLFPYHLAISPHWLVHYWTSGMEGAAWKRAEEEQFLAHPAEVIGGAAWQAVEQIGHRLGLDFGGIDFGVLADGRVVVFEANATMLVHPESDPQFAYRSIAIAAIQRGFAEMIDRHCSIRVKSALQPCRALARPLSTPETRRPSGM